MKSLNRRQPFPDALRLALWKVYKQRCFYCDHPISFRELQVDHIIPEAYCDDESGFIEIKSKFKLPNDFNICGLENFIASCGSCNRKKSDHTDDALISMALGAANRNAKEVERRWIANEKTAGGSALLAKMGCVLENGSIAIEDLLDYAGEKSWELGQLTVPCPDSWEARANSAVNLLRSGRLTESLSIFNQLCRSTNELKCFLGRSLVLRALKQPKEALSSLLEQKARFLGNPYYLVAVLELAYAADQEEIAPELLQQLIDLEKQGKTGGIFRSESFESVKAKFEEMAKRAAESTKEFSDQLIRGQLTWILVDQVRHRNYFVGWAVRTQNLSWLDESAVSRSMHSIYSSNHFTVREDKDGNFDLRPIECTKPGGEAVIDLSALITLEKLGLFSMLPKYFSRLHVPASYIPYLVEQTIRLQPHQMSEIRSRNLAVALLQDCRIEILPRTLSDKEIAVPIVADSISDRDRFANALNIKALLLPLVERNIVTNQQFLAIKVSTPESGASATFNLGDDVCISAEAIRDLARLDHLEKVAAHFCVKVPHSDYRSLMADAQTMDNLAEIERSHDRLLAKIKDDGFFSKIRNSADSQETDENDQIGLSLEAVHLASSKGLPLIADDRSCQMVVLNQKKKETSSAFGSDILLDAFKSHGILSDAEYSKAYLQLIRWRYRFLVVPAEVLTYFALQNRSFLPGPELREIARYLHQCMDDPGLFAGPEPTSNKAPVAAILFQCWTRIVGDFIVQLSKVEGLGDEEFSKAVKWACVELMPSVPRYLGPLAHRLTQSQNLTLLSHLVFSVVGFEDSEQANKILTTTSSALGMDEEDYISVIFRVIDAIRL